VSGGVITKRLTFVIALLLAATTQTPAHGQAWRGIIPLRSTREDVERQLGAPAKKFPGAYYYNLPGEVAVVRFQAEACDGESGMGRFGYGWDVPLGTVTTISVIPKANLRKEKFLAGRGFSADASAPVVYYTRTGGGLSVETLNGFVTLMNYTPTQKEAELRQCPRTQDCCVDFFHKFDEYVELSFEDEKGRLDNYAIQLEATLGRGVITAYGENPRERRRIMKQEKRAREYLAQKHGIEPQRILIADGGYQKTSSVGLHIYSIGGPGGRIQLYRYPDPVKKVESAN
jgi:hypothetical protein